MVNILNIHLAREPVPVSFTRPVILQYPILCECYGEGDNLDVQTCQLGAIAAGPSCEHGRSLRCYSG
jgi:hypothetical protein